MGKLGKKLLKVTNDERMTIKNPWRLFTAPILGICIIYGGVMSLIDGSDTFFGYPVVPCILFGVLLTCATGAVAIIKSKSYSRKQKYLIMIESDGITNIDEIASTLGVNHNTALQEIRQMIDKGVLGNAYLNEAERKIVIRKNEGAQSVVSVICKSCGATNKINSGSAAVCEYCGAGLDVK